MATIVNLQRNLGTCLVKTYAGKIFPVKIQGKLVSRVNVNDAVELKKSPVSGEWVITGVKV